MRRSQPTLATRTPAGEVPARAGGHDERLRRITALVVGMVVACLATLTLTTLYAADAPSIHPPVSHDRLASDPAASVPADLASTASASIGTSERSFWPIHRGAELRTDGGSIHSTFTAAGAALHVHGGTLSLSLAAIGGRRLAPVEAVAPTDAAGQVLYTHGSVSEFYRNGPFGLEQGFTVGERPQPGTGGSLVLALRLAGSFVPEQVGSQILFRTRAGATALSYGQLAAWDATGRQLPAHMQLHDGSLRLRIDDGHAR